MEYTALLEKQILGRLKVDNPWWTEGKIPSYYQVMSPRLYLDIFYPLVKDISIQRALILMGPRRVVNPSFSSTSFVSICSKEVLRRNLEIDFVVNRHDERLYIQSAYALPDKEKVDQEQASLLNINDGFRKLIIVGDRYRSGYNEEGILMMSLSDFLLGKE